MNLKIEAIPAFTDNYIWMLSAGNRAAVVDPGDAAPVQKILDERGLELGAILITHWHPDHSGGIAALSEQSNVPVYGPAAEGHKFKGLTHPLKEGSRLTLDFLNLELETIAIPGHTLGHIALHGGGLLFCGDTMFSAGCGRLFEGTAAQMHASLSRLAALPDDTAMYCGHEYTLANLAFAAAVEPDSADITAEIVRVRHLRTQNKPSLPSTVGHEKRHNPFLRCHQPAIKAAVEAHSGTVLADEIGVFAALRKWKDTYKA